MKLNKKVKNVGIIFGVIVGIAVGCSDTENTTTSEVTASNQKVEASKGNDVIEEQEKEAAKEEVTEDDTVSFEFKQAKEKAKEYMAFQSFSKKGLKEQLEFEGFSSEAAEWAVENYNADWSSQACAKAREYLEFQSFSKQGLKDQLIFEGFTEEEAQYAVDNVYK